VADRTFLLHAFLCIIWCSAHHKAGDNAGKALLGCSVPCKSLSTWNYFRPYEDISVDRSLSKWILEK
jgi:hypothetical protein